MLPQLVRLKTHLGFALDIGAYPPREIGVEDDLMIFLVKPECAWVQERLTVARRGDMSHVRSRKKARIHSSSRLYSGSRWNAVGVLIAIIAGHVI